MSDIIHIATIGAPFGVRGHLRLKTNTENPKNALSYGSLTDHKGRAYTFKLIRVENDNTLIVSEESTLDRTAAEGLRGIKLFVQKKDLPTLKNEDEFYTNDLIGMTAYSLENELLGNVLEVHNYGASDILTLRMTDGTLKQIAFIRDSVLTVDHLQKKITLVKEHLL